MRWRLLLTLSVVGIWTTTVQAQAALRPSVRSRPATILAPRGNPILYEIRIPDVNATTVKAYDSDEHVFIPLEALLEFAGLNCRIDSIRKRVTFNKRTLALNPATTFWADNALYIPLTTLTSALGIDALIDRTEAAIVLGNVATLPVVRQAVREAARAAFVKARDAAAQPPAPLITPSSTWGSVLFDYAMFQQRTGTRTNTSYTLAAATPVGAGTLITRLSTFGRTSTHEISWLGVWPDTRELKQLRLGYGPSSGLGVLPIQGLYLSNAPLTRPSQFNILQLAGSLPPDWSVEAYRNGTLLGFDTIGSGGRFLLDVPVQYGENPFDLVAYGPAGETVRFGRMIRTQPSMVPKGEFEFAASTGACVSTHCNWMMNLDFRYGLSHRWSIRGGATEYTWSNGQPVNVYPYVALDGVVGRGVTLNAEFMRRGYSQVGLSWDPTQSFTLMGNYSAYSTAEAGTMFASGTRNQLWMFTRMSIPRTSVALETQVTRINSIISQHTFLRTGASIMLNNTTLRPYLRVSQGTETRTTSMGMDAVVSGGSLPFSFFHPWALRSTFEAQQDGTFTYAEAMLTRSTFFGLSSEAGLRWYPGSRPYIALALSTDVGQVRTQTNTVSSLNGSLLSMQQAFSGSVRWDADTRQLLRSADPILDRAGIAGVVFLDANHNGILDSDDPPIANASVSVGNTTVVTNSRGYYELWGIAPGQIVTVSIDPTTLESPWWIPAMSAMRITTAPNRSVSLNLPVVTGGVVEGTLVTDNVPANLPITFRHRETGRTYTIIPFSDGTFYQMGMLPGLYDARIQGKLLAQHKAVSSSVLVFVTPGKTSQVEVFVSRAE